MSIPCKMRPAGLYSLPLGYTRLEYLQAKPRGYQIIKTNLYPTNKASFKARATKGEGNVAPIWDTYIAQSNSLKLWGQDGWVYGRFGIQSAGWSQIAYPWRLNMTTNFLLDNGKLYINDVLKYTFTEQEFSTGELFLFGPGRLETNAGIVSLHSFEYKEDNIRKLNFIPALDHTGRPCMFDTVTRKPFYNQGTGEFIAGMTAKQARHLAYLPATGGNLTISLPLAAAFDAKVQNALTTASAKGWIFTFYWTEVIEYLTPRINAIVGEGNYTMSYDYTARKLSLSFALSVTNEQIDEVKNLLDSDLLKDLVVEMEWADGLPINAIPAGYKRLYYLESTGTQTIDTGVLITDTSGARCTMEYTGASPRNWGIAVGAFNSYGLSFTLIARYAGNIGFQYASVTGYPLKDGSFVSSGDAIGTLGYKLTEKCDVALNWLNDKQWVCEFDSERLVYSDIAASQAAVTASLYLFCRNLNGTAVDYERVKIYRVQISQGEQEITTFIPALNTEGQPGMYDIANKVFKTNIGTGDFIYPGAEQAAQTLDLDWDAKFYAKLTEHGVRRLYHVPKGYNGTKDDYAAANGFKELVEPPMPLEGYWTSQWRETETQLICDWVETDPPIESLEES